MFLLSPLRDIVQEKERIFSVHCSIDAVEEIFQKINAEEIFRAMSREASPEIAGLTQTGDAG